MAEPASHSTPEPSLSVQHTDALWDAIAIPGPHTPTFTEQHERVCRAVADIILEVTAVQAPTTDRGALRDRIAEALMRWAEGNNAPQYAAMRRPETVRANAYSRADAVLTVLPAPVDRAAVLREAADEAERVAESLRAHHEFERSTGALDVMTELRRLADEAQPAEHVCKPGASTYHCPTSGQTESDCHGGFDTCCDRPDLHQPAVEVQQDGARS
jgi:hypothetical protein